MTRRKNESVVDILFDLSAMLPWWAGVLLAIASYFVCHAFAASEVTSAKTAAEFGSALQQSIIKGLASVAQYVLPMIFLAGAAVSGYRQAKRGKSAPATRSTFDSDAPGNFREETASPAVVFDRPREPKVYPDWHVDSGEIVPRIPVDTTRWNMELLHALEWRRFEMVCEGLFERLGFRTESAGRGADGGVDIRLYRGDGDEAAAIVQCKAWTGSSKVGVRFIRELHGVMASMKVAEGIFATTATFSEEAKNYAKANHIDLMDGAAVLGAILKLAEGQQASLLLLATAGDYTTPTCPSCAVKLVKREPKGGGKAFWGCVNFPKCRTILNIAKA